MSHRITLGRTLAAYTVRDGGGGDDRPLCAVEGCEAPGVAHDCPADGSRHYHGMIHYTYCGDTGLTFRKGEWHLICDEHYAVCVAARRAFEVHS